MHKSEGGKGQESTVFAVHLRHARRAGHRARHLSRFGRAVVGLWPTKPGADLAHAACMSERNANQLISGERKVTAKAIVVLDKELLE